MKKIFKKNQVIITALAIMIAVAGYINYSDNHLGIDGVLQKASTDSTDETAQTASDTDGIVEEIESLDYDLTDETALTEENARAQEDSQGDCLHCAGFPHTDPFSQKEQGKEDGQHGTGFVDGHHFIDISCLQGTEIAKPGGASGSS